MTADDAGAAQNNTLHIDIPSQSTDHIYIW